MLEIFSTWLVTLLGVYGLIGLLFALPFVLRGAGQIDEAARQGSWGFRLLILPGVIALWPRLAIKWLAARHNQ